MTVKEFACNNTAEFLNLVDIPVNCLLKNLVNYLEVTGEVRTLETAGQVDINVKIRDEYDRSLSGPVHFYEFFNILDPDACQVDADIRR
jgi:hypothetical protein